MATLAKFVNGIDKATKRLAEIANQYSMTVLMANSVGQADGAECVGKTSVWNNQGELLGQLDDSHEGLIIFDTDTQKLTQVIA